jgi:hypothetical protein
MEPIVPQPPLGGHPDIKEVYSGSTNQNFVDEVAVVTAERRSELWKSLVLEVFAVGFAGLFGYFFASYLIATHSFWWVLVSLLLWGAAEVMVGLLEKSFKRRLLFMVIESVALVIFFHVYPWPSLAVMAIVAFLFLTWGHVSLRRELRNTIEIRFFTASGKVVGKIVTIAVIFMVLMYALFTTTSGSFFISENGFSVFFNLTSGFFNDFYPTIPLNTSFGDFAQAVAHVELIGNAEFQNLTPNEQNLALSQSTNDIITSFASSTAPSGVVTASTPTENAFYEFLSSFAWKLQSRFNELFTGGWGVILFLILRSVGIIVVWIGQLVAMIFYELLLAAGFMKIKEESATKEILEY